MPADLLVIGGGPAGLATAIAARLQGLTVTLADGIRPPIDKACGEAILPAGVEVLQRLGVHCSADDGFWFRGIRFVSDGLSVEAEFPSGCGLAMRRTRLHEMLTERASQLGVRLLWGTHLSEAERSSSGGWIVGADGQGSQVRRAAGMDGAVRESHRFGFRRHYRAAPWSDLVEVHWGSRCQIYVTPVAGDEVGVALLSRDPHLRLDDALTEFPRLARRLRGAEASSTERGAATFFRRLRRVFRDRTALVGDASGSVDAITGDGLSLAFHQAEALAGALRAGDLARYQAAHSRLARRPALAASLLLTLDRFPALRRGVLRLLALEPPLFAMMLARHGASGAALG
ncbi:MAG TPA: NAD(P)/FAD-dependent oxidoreductase [Bryobacteraceae bacterium]|nr:NAD(P)/FAD-dependent oxidoreductase [Bryobacteraceae bacterium]